jgi:hypothetical protein
MTTQNTASSTPPVAPKLQSKVATGTADNMHIALEFNTTMVAAGGTIIVTDGAVQTVIDRDTGLPTLRVVGATDTHAVSASSLVINGNTVTLNVTGLQSGHTYSVVMGADALQSDGHLAFGGVRSTSQVTFATPDITGPTVSVTTDGGVLKAGGSIAVTLTFSEAVKALPADALNAQHAGITGLTTTDGIVWHATLTAPADATTAIGNILSLDMSKVSDLAGNPGTGTVNLASYTVDTQAPTATVTLDTTTLASGRDAVATIQFSEAVTSLTEAALSAGHATVSNLHTTDGGVTWLATLSGTAGTTAGGNVLAVDLAQVRDLAGNAGSGSAASAVYTVDTQGPSSVAIALDGATLAGGKSVHATFTFAESVHDLPFSAITAPHAAVSGIATSDGGKTWTATLTANDNGTWTGNAIGVDLTKLVDLAGNPGTGTIKGGSYTVDTQGPTATLELNGSAMHTGSSLGLTLHFSDAVTDLTTAALQTPNATVANLQHSDDYLTWTATLTPQAGVTGVNNVVGLDLAQVHDAAGNAGSGSTFSPNYAVDTQGPGATLALDGTALTIQFSEAVTDLTAAALQAPNDTLANLQHSADYLTWTATMTPLVDGGGNAVTLDLALVHDAFGNAGSGMITAGTAAPADITPPTVADVLFDGTTLGPTRSVGFTITFSESVTGLTAAALQTPYAKVSGLATLDGRTWTGILSAADGAPSSKNNLLGVDLTQVHDAAGNAGTGTATSLSHYDIDTDPLTASVALDGSALVSGGAVGVTIRFSAPVTALDASVLNTPHAALADLHHSDDNLTWYATLSAADAGIVAATNAVSLDLTKVHDTFGNAGSGTASSGNYTFDTTVAAYVSQIEISDAGPYDNDGVTNVGNPAASGFFFGTLTASQHLEVTLDGQSVSTYGVTIDSPVGSLTGWSYYNEGYLSAGAHTYTASIVDDTGHASVTLSKQFTIDMTAPNLTGSPNGATAFDTTGNLVLTFDKAVYWTNTDNVYYGLQFHTGDGGTTYISLADSNFSSDHKTITLTPDQLHLGTGNDYTLDLSSSLTDLAGNMVADRSIGFHTAGPYVDVTPPSATALTTTAAAGYAGIGTTVEMHVAFSEAVNVVGTPVLLLNNGAQAAFLNMSDDHRTAVFAYTVAAGDQDIAGLNMTDRSGLAGHFTDGAGHSLDAQHIIFGYLGDSTYG